MLKIKSKILSNVFNEKYGLKLWEFNSTTGTERVKFDSTHESQHNNTHGTHSWDSATYDVQAQLWLNYTIMITLM